MSDGKWSIALFREPQEKPFDHPFSVESPDGKKWVARSLSAAIRLVDEQIFRAGHPELGDHSRHAI